MNVSQLSVFIEDRSGRVSEVTDALGAANVNIRGFSVSDTADSSTIRLVVDDPAAGVGALTAAGFTVEENPVICISTPDHPGGLSGVLRVVSEAGVNIEYVYSLVSTFVVINVSEITRAVGLLAGAPVTLVGQEDIARL